MEGPARTRSLLSRAISFLFPPLRRTVPPERADRLAKILAERSLFEAALRALPAGVVLAEAPSGRVILSNEQAAHILRHPLVAVRELADYDPDHVGFHADGRPYQPEDWPLARAMLFGEEVRSEEAHLVAGDGSRIVVKISAAPIRDSEKRIVAAVTAIFDVTREREAERAFGANEARIKRLFESNIIGILYSNSGGRLTGANDAFLDMIGRTREELERGEINWMGMTPEEWREADQRAIDEMISTGACAPYEKEYLRGDGRRVSVLLGAAILPERREAVGFVLDLTERKQAEERLQFLAEAGQALSESLEHDETLACLARLTVPDFADYCIVFEIQDKKELRQVAARHADPAREPLVERLGEIYERSPENPASSLWRVARTGRSELVTEVTQGMAAAVTGDPDLLDIYHRLAARSFMVVPLAARNETLGVMLLATAAPGRMFGPLELALGEELASRAALAIDNARLYGQAQAASRAKDHFLAALSHELRTPLTPVLLKAAMLRESPDVPSAFHADLRMIQRNVELEAKLIDDLLDLTRITRGKLALHREVTDVHLLLDHVVKICADEATAKRLRIDLSPEAALHHVWADEARLQQVFWNLLKNAVKFTPSDGRIEIRTANEAPGTIRIDVIDRGIGIEPETLPRLFNAFEQGDSSITRTFGGLGLGLAICKALVDQHGGELAGVSAGRGKGATFTVALDTVPAPPQGEQRAGAVLPACEERPLRLLLVEDHEPTLQVMTALLEAAGHTVKAAGDLASARRLAAEGELDLLVSDLGLPDGSGLELMRELRERSGLRGIAVSGYGMEEDLRRSREAGFAEHLIKPVDPGKLRAAITRAAAGG